MQLLDPWYCDDLVFPCRLHRARIFVMVTIGPVNEIGDHTSSTNLFHLEYVIPDYCNGCFDFKLRKQATHHSLGSSQFC